MAPKQLNIDFKQIVIFVYRFNFINQLVSVRMNSEEIAAASFQASKTVHKSKEIFLGGLLTEHSENDIRKLLSQFGTILQIRHMRYSSGESKGFAFVKFATPESARDVVSAGKLRLGKVFIDCKLSLTKTSAKNTFAESLKKKIYVGNLPSNSTEESLFNYFSQFGPVSLIRIITKKGSSQSRGFAFIQMEHMESVENILHGSHCLQGKTLSIRHANSKTKKDLEPNNKKIPLPKKSELENITNKNRNLEVLGAAPSRIPVPTKEASSCGISDSTQEISPAAVSRSSCQIRSSRLSSKGTPVRLIEEGNFVLRQRLV